MGALFHCIPALPPPCPTMLAQAAVAVVARVATTSAACRRGLHVTPASLAHILLLDNINPVAGQVFHDAGHTTDVMAPMPEAELLEVRKILLACRLQAMPCHACLREHPPLTTSSMCPPFPL